MFFRSPPVWDVFWLRAWCKGCSCFSGHLLFEMCFGYELDVKGVHVFQVTSCLRWGLAMSLIKGCSCFSGHLLFEMCFGYELDLRVFVFFRSPPVWDVFWLRAWLKGVRVFQVTSCLRCVLVTSLIKGCSCFSGHLLFEMCFTCKLD